MGGRKQNKGAQSEVQLGGDIGDPKQTSLRVTGSRGGGKEDRAMGTSLSLLLIAGSAKTENPRGSIVWKTP